MVRISVQIMRALFSSQASPFLVMSISIIFEEIKNKGFMETTFNENLIIVKYGIVSFHLHAIYIYHLTQFTGDFANQLQYIPYPTQQTVIHPKFNKLFFMDP
jgi:hypothetical protein